MLKRIIISLALVLSVVSAGAQLTNSLNAFSPYTMYGLGDLMMGGNIGSKSMGGLGVAMRNTSEFNYLNPASLSALPRQTAVFNFGVVSSNYYQSYKNQTTSYNGLDLSDVGFAIPLYKGIGLGVSLTPVSAVGYKTSVIYDNPSITEDIGRAIYSYYGEGGVSQLALNLGVKVVAGLSLGATFNYYFGSIDRHWESNILSLIEQTDYRRLKSTEFLRMDHLRYSFGFQYQFRVGDDDQLTIGATYMPSSLAKMNRKRLSITQSSLLTDTVAFSNGNMSIKLPDKLSAGIYYNNAKFGIGFDYHRQDWTNSFETPSDISLCAVNDYRFGAQYTPDRYSLRSFFSRLTYKVGARYANSYLMRNNVQLNEWCVTLGADVPLKLRNFSAFNIGVEYGQRGSYDHRAVRENYFKVYLGLSLFADNDMWFVKRKFN